MPVIFDGYIVPLRCITSSASLTRLLHWWFFIHASTMERDLKSKYFCKLIEGSKYDGSKNVESY